jgi:hypothetical protein
MAYGLILEFQGVGRNEYEAVSKALGIDQTTGKGNWPPGILSHSAGMGPNGVWTVMEVWKSKEDQGRFMQSRLGAAVAGAGITSPPTATWIELLAYHTPNA